MPRLLIVGFLLAIVAIFVVTVSFLAYGYSPTRDGKLSVQGLEAPVQIGWDEHGIPWIHAESDTDAAAALGYVHAVDQSESIVLWRQAALGKLNAWKGAQTLSLDLFARRLGFDRLARDAYQNLQGDDRRWLDAYTTGINRALETPGVRQKEAFIREGITPELWEPWDALAVERLIAYLATSPLRLDSTYQALARRDSAVAQFAETDSLFRSTLGLRGWRHGRAYGTNQGIVYHQPLGSSALPVIAGAIIEINDQTTALGTIPGTPMMPFGRSQSRAWAIVLSSRASIEPAGGPLPSQTFERLVATNGDETLIRLIRDENGLVLNPLTGWRLSWSGFQATTDVTAWRMLATSDTPPPFTLIRGAGVLRDGNRLQVTGAPVVQTQSTNYAFASEHPAATSAVRRLENIQDASLNELAQDTGSPWAASRITPLLQSLPAFEDSALADPLAFLRGWDYHFAANDVSPTLFEHWLKAINEVIDPVSPDSALSDWRLPLTLRLGTAMVEDAQGKSESDWRWQRTFTNRPAPPFNDPDWTCRPFTIPEGHPTSLLPGPSHYIENPPGPAMWSSWISFDDASWSIRRPVCAPEIPTTTAVQTIDLQSPPRASLRLVPDRQ